MVSETYTSSAAVKELGQRIKAYRIDFPLTQKQLSERSGVSLRCIQRLENGEDIQVTNLFKVLQALELTDRFDVLIPDMDTRPSAYLPDKKDRRRVRHAESSVRSPRVSSSTRSPKMSFRWGDEK